jgi:hypothetical protein
MASTMLTAVLMVSMITSMQVYYGEDVKVVLNYDLGANKLGSILFGVDLIKNDILSIFKSDNYTIERMDFEKAIVVFKPKT